MNIFDLVNASSVCAEEATELEELLTKAGIDFIPEEECINGKNSGCTSETHKMIIKRGVDGTPTECLGVVGKKYVPVDNKSGFEWATNLPECVWKRAGKTAQGMYFVMGELKDEPSVDDYRMGIILKNSFNGKVKLSGQIVILDREGYYLPFCKEIGSFNIVHKKNIKAVAAFSTKVLNIIENFRRAWKAEVDMLGSKLFCTEAAIDKVVNDLLFPIPNGASARLFTTQTIRREKFWEKLKNEIKKAPGKGATALTLFKAFSIFIQDEKIKKAKMNVKKRSDAFENIIDGKVYKDFVKILKNLEEE